MSSKRSVKAMLKRARRASEPFTVRLGDDTLEGTFTVLPFMKWQTLLASHPPRDGNVVDEGWGFSYATFWPALIRESTTEPDMDDEDWATLLDVLPQGEMIRLGSQAFALNMRMREEAVDVPKSSSTSEETEAPSSD